MSPKTNQNYKKTLERIIAQPRPRKPIADIRGIGVVAQAEAVREFLHNRAIRISIQAHRYAPVGEVRIKLPTVEHVHDWELPGAPARQPGDVCEECRRRIKAREALETLVYAAFPTMNDPRGPFIFQ